jgi:ribonuclease HI
MRQNTPTTGLEVLFGVSPLQLYILSMATSTYNRLGLTRGLGLWTAQRSKRVGHIKWLQKQAKLLPNRNLQDYCVANNWTRLYSTFIGDGEDISHKSSINCYTDGSGCEHGSGSGVVTYEGDNPDPIFQSSAYTGKATVFQSEIYALQMACDYVTPMSPPKVIFLSDSQSLIEALTNPLITSRTVLRTAMALNTLAKQGTKVWIQWVRGHNGSDGNELADHMANLGAAFLAEGPEPERTYRNIEATGCAR